MSTPPDAPIEPDGWPRSSRKRRAILEAATDVFLRNGYLGTSMDEIAALAGVSKQTVYKHFGDKERLFIEIVVSTVAEISDPNYADVLGLADSDGNDIEADLRDLARRQLTRVMQPQLLALRRLVIGEAIRFPDLGRTFYEQGPGRTITALATAFERLAARGVLRLDDPALAAAHFNWLVMSIPLNQAMLCGDGQLSGEGDDRDRDLGDRERDSDGDRDRDRELDRYADAGVRTFLAAYHGPSQGTARH